MNYFEEYNRVTQPPDYKPELNAVLHYEKAFEAFVEIPESMKSKWRAWPTVMSENESNILTQWLNSNSETFDYLKKAVEKPFCWFERHSQENDLSEIDLADASMFKACAHGLLLRAKLVASEGQIQLAFEDILVLNKMGLHLLGPVTLLEQLVGLAILQLAYDAALTILSKKKIDNETLANLQIAFEQQQGQLKGVNFSIGEKIYCLNEIQRLFTDNSTGNGRLKVGEFYKSQKNSLWGKVSYLQALRISFKQPRRLETMRLIETLHKGLDILAKETPWELHKRGTSYGREVVKLIGKNYIMNVSAGPFAMICEINHRPRVSGEALITTIAILRYRNDTGNLPDSLQELVSRNYIKKLPMDPYSDGSLVYKKVDDDFVLYSLGADLKDDGGTPSRWGEGTDEEGGDQVFWPVQIEAWEDVTNDK